MTDSDMVLKCIDLKKELGRLSPAYIKRKFGINNTHAAKICWLVENILIKESDSIKRGYNHVE